MQEKTKYAIVGILATLFGLMVIVAITTETIDKASIEPIDERLETLDNFTQPIDFIYMVNCPYGEYSRNPICKGD